MNAATQCQVLQSLSTVAVWQDMCFHHSDLKYYVARYAEQTRCTQHHHWRVFCLCSQQHLHRNKHCMQRHMVIPTSRATGSEHRSATSVPTNQSNLIYQAATIGQRRDAPVAEMTPIACVQHQIHSGGERSLEAISRHFLLCPSDLYTRKLGLSRRLRILVSRFPSRILPTSYRNSWHCLAY